DAQRAEHSPRRDRARCTILLERAGQARRAGRHRWRHGAREGLGAHRSAPGERRAQARLRGDSGAANGRDMYDNGGPGEAPGTDRDRGVVATGRGIATGSAISVTFCDRRVALVLTRGRPRASTGSPHRTRPTTTGDDMTITTEQL